MLSIEYIYTHTHTHTEWKALYVCCSTIDIEEQN